MSDPLAKLAAKANGAKPEPAPVVTPPLPALEEALRDTKSVPEVKAPAQAPAPEIPAAKPAAADKAKKDDPPAQEAPPAEDPLKDVKFPALDKLASHFYDNEAGTFWVGLNLRGNGMALPMVLDAAKLPLLDAFIDFQSREAKRRSLIARVSGKSDEVFATVKESLSAMMERLKNVGGAGTGKKKSILAK